METELDQTIRRVREGNARQNYGVSQHMGSDIARLLVVAEEVADLRRQLAEAQARESTDIAEAANLRRQLAEVQAANQWHKPAEAMPAEFVPIVAYWQEDGAWITILYPTDSGLVDDADNRWNTYPDVSWRPAPVCWRYIPGPPGLVPDMAQEEEEEEVLAKVLPDLMAEVNDAEPIEDWERRLNDL